MANIAYVRVSTRDQNEARQIEALKEYEIDKWFKEKVSGKNTASRNQYLEMMDWVREGDTVYVTDFSRLARSTQDLLKTIDSFKTKKVNLKSLKEDLDTSTATGKLMVTVMAAINEFERENLLERQAEGIALAKQRGAYKGRKRIEVKDFGKYYEEYMQRKVSKSALARQLGISRPTLDRLIEDYLQV